MTAHLSALSQLYGELSCGKQQLTEEEFLECVSTFLAHQNVARRKQQSTATQAMIDTMFLALDVDDKGYLSPKEWEVLFYMWNFPDIETCAVEAFKGTDKNKDGQISLEEFQEYNVSLYIYQILMCVCVCVRDGSGMFVGRDWTSDARPSYFNLPNLELREECSSMHGLEQLQADAMREQQSKRMQSGSSS